MLSYGVARPDQPALSTLRAFAAAGRHESVRQAADELGVTPSAVSHQIRILETWVGAALFVRAPRRIRLTPLGRTLFAKVNTGFETIARAVVAARHGARDTSLRVSALPLFTSVWLIPRLERFHRVCEKAGAEISIDLDTTSALADFDGDTIDVAIRNVRRPTANLVARKLLDLNAVPLCAAAVAERLVGPEDLAGSTLIHISGRRDGWQRWLDACGVGHIRGRRNLSVDTVPAALEAAAAGRGITLGVDPLVWDAPVASRLVIPFKAPRVSAGAYFVVYRSGDRSRRAVKLFADWIEAEMKVDRRRLSVNSRNAQRAARLA
ncbi:MAG: LysR family transcriptional regulator [Reyranella sp.]|nr:LysR family transcriptional regulator [Reyranella sp.]